MASVALPFTFPRVHNHRLAVDQSSGTCVNGTVVVVAIVPDRDGKLSPLDEVPTDPMAPIRAVPGAVLIFGDMDLVEVVVEAVNGV